MHGDGVEICTEIELKTMKLSLSLMTYIQSFSISG